MMMSENLRSTCDVPNAERLVLDLRHTCSVCLVKLAQFNFSITCLGAFGG